LMAKMLPLLLLYLLVPSQMCLAQGSELRKVDIVAIKRMHLRGTDAEFLANVVVIIKNDGDINLKLRNMKFDVSFGQEGNSVPFGKANVEEIIIPKGTEGNPGKVELNLNVKVGPKNDSTVNRLVSLFNMMANPETAPSMLLSGTAEVGTETERGWIYQSNVKAELKFKPSLQREVLFN
jgi:hypothetical protein